MRHLPTSKTQRFFWDKIGLPSVDEALRLCVFSNNFPYQGGEYGNAVLSRFPVLSWTNTYYRMLRTNEQRGVLQVTARVADQPLVFMATHVDYRPDDVERRQNAEQLAEILDRYPGLTVIVGGDFNDVPNGRLHRKMKERWQDVWESIGTGEGFTIPSRRPTKRIDYPHSFDLARDQNS